MINQLLLLAEGPESGSHTLWDFVANLPPGDRAPVIILSLSFIVVLVMILTAVISKTMCRMHKARLEDALKRELVDRGFSADEIAKVVETSPLAEQRGPRHIWGRKAC